MPIKRILEKLLLFEQKTLTPWGPPPSAFLSWFEYTNVTLEQHNLTLSIPEFLFCCAGMFLMDHNWFLETTAENRVKTFCYFVRSLLRMLDNLWLDECGPLRLAAQGWLLHSLLRGDAARLLDPLLLPLLSPATARVSVLRVTVRLRSTVQAAKIYAISTLDGSVIYHVSSFATSGEITNPNCHPVTPTAVKVKFYS